MVDTATPKNQLQFNYVMDLPFGRCKRFLGNANRILNKLVGGYQIAGDGNVVSSAIAITATNWGSTNPIKYYKHGAPITECSSGTCYKTYLWWNGYIAPTAINGSTCATGLSSVESGLPADYKPYRTPLGQGCSTPTGTPLKAVTDTNFGANNVSILFPGAATGSSIAYAPSPIASSSAVGLEQTRSPRPSSTDHSTFSPMPRCSKSSRSPRR